MTTFDCSILYIADRSVVKDSLSVTASYYQNPNSDHSDLVDYRDWQIPLGRRFRSLKLFFVIRMFGVSALQRNIRSFVKIAEQLEKWILEDDRFELVFPRSFTLLIFRLRNQENQKTRQLLEALNETGKILLTPIEVEGIYCIRFSIGTPWSTLEHVKEAWKLIQTFVKG